MNFVMRQICICVNCLDDKIEHKYGICELKNHSREGRRCWKAHFVTAFWPSVIWIVISYVTPTLRWKVGEVGVDTTRPARHDTWHVSGEVSTVRHRCRKGSELQCWNRKEKRKRVKKNQNFPFKMKICDKISLIRNQKKWMLKNSKP